MKRFLSLLTVLAFVGITNVWGVDTPVATFSASGVIGNSTTYSNYGNTDFYLSRGGNKVSAGWNKNTQAVALDSTWGVGGITAGSTYGFYVKCKPGRALSNINKIVITSSATSNSYYSTGDKLYLLYSTNNGKSWSQISLTSGTQGASAGTAALNKTFQFNTISSARYIVLFSGASTSYQKYKFDELQIEFYGAYTVTLDANGGTVSPASVTQNSYGAAVTLPTPTKTGYSCTGWFTSTSGGTKRANAGANYTPTANETVHAQWTAKTISLTLNKNNSDASGSSNGSASVKYDATALESGTVHATRTGYELEGYYAEEACTHKVLTNEGALVNYAGYVVSGKWARETTPTTLYAKWTPLASCSATPSIGAVSLNGPFSLTQVPLTSSVTNEGGTGCSISAVGFVWKAGSDPSASDNPKAGTYSNGTITGSLPSSGSFAANGTTYYIKAYATNGAGTAVSSSSFQFTPLSVTFDNQGHGSTPETQYLKSGDKAEDPNFTNITGYTFGGWFTNEGCTAGNEWDFTSNTVTLSNTTNGNLTLYAKWTVKTHVFDWSWAGGSTTSTTHTPANANMPYGTAITYPANNTMSKTGYNFTGWNSDATTMPDGDLTITAQWQAKTTAITLNKNNSDASGTEAGSASWTYDQTAKNSITAATRTGYTVNGYYTAASGGTKILNADGSLAGNAITVDAVVYTNDGKWAYNDTELTLYAQWSPITYTVAFDKNNTSASGSMDNQTGFTYGVGKQLSKNTFTIDASLHKYFAGWSKSSTATEPTYIDEQSVTDVATTSGTITLYAVWKDYTYTNYRIICCTKHDVTLADNGETEEGEWIVVPDRACVDVDVALEAEAKTGYEFAAWKVTKTSDESDITDAVIKSGSSKTNAEATIVMPDYGITVNATFSPLVYNITYKDKGDVAFSGTHETGYPETHTYNAATTLKGATKTDYNFIGWYDNADCDGEPVTSIAANSISADITLYAKWVPDNKWVVTISAPTNGTISVSYYDTEDETQKELTSGSREILKNTEITITATGSTGYDCTGVTVNGEAFTSGTSMTLGSAITIAATFGLHTYDITYNLDGGNNNVGNPANYQYTSSDITLLDPTKTGYTFKGWFNNSDLAEEHKVTGVAIATGSAADKEFWAKWEINKHAFTWNFDEGSSSATAGEDYTAANAQMPYGTAITYPEGTTMSKEGYHFTGWSSDATTMPDADLTITAQWEINTYEVHWYVNDVEWTDKGGSETVEHGSTATLPTAPTKADGCGDKFMGWTTIEDYTGNGAPDPLYTTPPTITGDTNFYAVFADYGE